MKMRIIDSGRGAAKNLMEKDTVLLNSLQDQEVILHLYEWERPCTFTYGCFMKPNKFFIMNQEECNIDCSVRPTGGGFTFHHGDYAFSLLMSATHPMYHQNVLLNYQTVNRLVVKALDKVFSIHSVLASCDISVEEGCNEHFCSAKVSKYDVLIGTKKVGGAAQRSLKQGFLHQGSIFLSEGDEKIYRQLLLPEVVDGVVDGIRNSSFFPLGVCTDVAELNDVRRQIKHQLIKLFSCGDL